MILLNNDQKIYLSLLIVGGVIVLLLLFFLIYRNFIAKRRIKIRTGKRLYRFANVNDYLLLNNYKIQIDEKNMGVVDHILITNKFIFVIHDFPISGYVGGVYLDEQLHHITRKNDELIANPLNYNRNLSKRLAQYNGLDNSFLKGIVVTNEDAYFDISELPGQFAVCRPSQLMKTIKKMDGVKIKPFKEDTIVNFINSLAKENQNEK